MEKLRASEVLNQRLERRCMPAARAGEPAKKPEADPVVAACQIGGFAAEMKYGSLGVSTILEEVAARKLPPFCLCPVI
jgi:hypothetical protein